MRRKQPLLGCSEKLRAFTLFEVFLVILLASILVFAGTAAWRHLVIHNQLNALANRLVRAIRFARSAAITRNTRVTFCGSKDKKDCDGDWNQGQVIFVDAHKIILQEFEKLPKGYQLTWRSSLGRHDFLQFAPDGFTNGQQGSFKICNYGNSDHLTGFTIIVLRSGRLAVKKINC